MVWTTPFTAVDGNALTAAQWNSGVRDNLNMTGPAVATAAGGFIGTNGLNSVIQRTPAGTGTAVDTTARTTTSTTYTATLSGGTNPVQSVTTGSVALVMWATAISNDTNAVPAYCSVACSGATTVAASDNWAIWNEFNTSANDSFRMMGFHWFTALNAGTNTFTMQYRVDSGTGRYNRREIWVLPL